MKLLLLYILLIPKDFSQRHKGTEDTKEVTEFVHPSLFLCELCVSVRDNENKIFCWQWLSGKM